ncbi:hypothetical protein KO317_03685 [Candidatus Micrarchaeota archaeon]|nr:hypothetical protein [Candidatus Micrarchaeota archaeon]
MFIWDKEVEDILNKYTSVSQGKEDFEELELEKLKLRLLLKTIESSKTLMEAEERGQLAKQKVNELCYAFSFASLLDRKKRIRKKIEKTQVLLQKLNTIDSKGEFYQELLKKTHERLHQYTQIESRPPIKRHTIEQVVLEEIEHKISKAKKQVLLRAITAPLKPGKEIRILLDKKNLIILSESTKLQYETEKSKKEIEEIFKIKELFGIPITNLNSPLVMDVKKQGNNIVVNIIEKIFEKNQIKTKNHSFILKA